MTDAPDELPEIQLEEILDEPSAPRAPTQAAPAPAMPDLDIDFSEPSTQRPLPAPVAAPKPAVAPVTPVNGPALDFDLDMDLPPVVARVPATTVASVAAPVVVPVPAPAPAIAPLPVPTVAPPVTTVAVQSPVVAKATSASLDLDALLADLETLDTNSTASAEVTLTPEEPRPIIEANPQVTADLGLPGELITPEAEPQVLAPPSRDLEPLLQSSLAATADDTDETDAMPGNLVEEPQLGSAPPLPLLESEPPARSALMQSDLPTTADAIETLKKLAGAGWDPDRTRTALTAALKGEAYEPRALPEPKVMMLGLARALVASGFAVDELVAAIMAAVLEE